MRFRYLFLLLVFKSTFLNWLNFFLGLVPLFRLRPGRCEIALLGKQFCSTDQAFPCVCGGGSPRLYTGEWTTGSVSRTSDCGAQAMFSAYLYQPWTEMFLSQMWVGKMGSFWGLIYGDHLGGGGKPYILLINPVGRLISSGRLVWQILVVFQEYIS